MSSFVCPEWDYPKLGDICDVRDGTHDSPKYVDQGYPLITSKNLTKNGLSFENVNFVSKFDHDAIEKRSAVDDGDILYGMIGTVGNPVVVKKDREFSVKNVAIFKFKSESPIYNRYLLYALESAFIGQQIQRESKGGTQKFVSLKVLRELKIPLPPLETQKQIAAVLEKADQLRKDCQQMEQELNNLAQAVFIERYSESSMHDLTFGELSVKAKNSFVNGPFGSNLLSSELTEKGVPVIYIRDIATGEFKRKKNVCVTKEKALQLDSCRVDAGDVLIAKVGDPPGTAAIYPEGQPSAIVTQDVIRIKCDEDLVVAEYLVAYLNSDLGAHSLKAITVEATRSRIGLGDLKKLSLRLPSKKNQLEFVEIRKHLTSLVDSNRGLIMQYEAGFNSLMQKAFKGELNLSQSA